MSQSEFNIREVKPSEASQLTQLAHLAKAHWGYSPEFMDAFSDELTYRSKDLKNDRYLFRVGTCDLTIRSFYALDFTGLSDQSVEMSALFVEPMVIGRGLGRALFEHAVQSAKALGAKIMMIHSDPYAEGFYIKMGAKTVGEVPSGSLKGRQLPLMQYTL